MADEVKIEREENYIKQTYRNRCYILSAGGIQALTIPVLLGSFHKTPIRDITIDYSKRWQQVHIRALEASYRSSPFFEFYFDRIENILTGNYKFLIDLNTDMTLAVLGMLDINKPVRYTDSFEQPDIAGHDFRYKISPKRRSTYRLREYPDVFGHNPVMHQGLSIIDLIFNMGPESKEYLRGAWL